MGEVLCSNALRNVKGSVNTSFFFFSLLGKVEIFSEQRISDRHMQLVACSKNSQTSAVQ